MALDPSIALQVRPFQLDDPLEKYGKVLAIKGAQRQFTMEDDIAQAAQATNGDPGQMADELMRRGQFTPAMQLRNQQQNQQRLNVADQREQRKFTREETEHALKLAEAGANDGIMLDQLWNQALKNSGGDPIAAVTEIQPVYSQVRQKWAQLGNGKTNLPEAFDPDQNRASIGQAKNFQEYLKSQRPEFGAPVNAIDPATGKPGLYQPNKNGDGRFIGVEPAASPAQPTELARLQSERDSIAQANPQDHRLADYDRVLSNYKAGHANDTNVTVNSGPMTPTKSAATKVDEDLLAATRGLMQLDAIEKQFKPEFQQFQDRIGFAALATKEKLGQPLSNKQRQDLTEFSAYRRNSVNSMNEYIKSITGAAMSEVEAERITKGMPNPGQSLFDGDSPTEFKSKMYDAMKQTKMAIARLSYIKRNGMSLMDGNGSPVISLTQMPDIINSRGKEIETELGKTGVKGAALDAAVYRQLATEFGFAHY